jgi:hypothetical protein
MMDIRRLNKTDVAAALGKIDLFICCASYEARCETIARQLRPELVSGAIVAENVNHRDLHGDHVSNLLGHFGPNTVLAETSTDDPIATADALVAALQSFVAPRRLVVDVTTFTHEALLILMRLIQERFASASVDYVYTRARDYSVTESREEKWLSRGVKEVRSVLGYPGQLLPSRKLHLILLAGIEPERATELVRAYEPSILSLGSTISHVSELGSPGDIVRERLGQLRAFFPSAHDFSFDPFRPDKTAAALRAQAGITRSHNVVIAPMSTKLSTIGAALVALEDQRIQLCYGTAVLYNHNSYSTPGDECYVVSGLEAPHAESVRDTASHLS